MISLYLDRQGTRLGRSGQRLTLHEKDTLLQEYPIETLGQILIYGQIQITTAALSLLLSRGIPTVFLTQRGWLHGHLAASCGGQVQRRRRQYALLDHPGQSLPIARRLVAAKLRNQRWLLRVLGIRTASTPLRQAIRSALSAPDAASLRGVEGAAARHYFEGLAQHLAGAPLPFQGRHRRPPTDPVNAMLSLGYTPLLGELQTAAMAHGLDPFAGIYHASDGAQPALALDLMEPLRCLVDRLVLRLAHHEFGVADFSTGEDGACLLGDGSRGRFYRAWETLLRTVVLYRGRHHPYRQVIQAQMAQWAQTLDNPEHRFRPFLLGDLGH